MMTPRHSRVKQGQKVPKIGTHTNCGSRNSNITFILNIDELFIIYSLNNDLDVDEVFINYCSELRPHVIPRIGMHVLILGQLFWEFI